MRILFDQGVPAPLRRHLVGHAVDTAFERGYGVKTTFVASAGCDNRHKSLQYSAGAIDMLNRMKVENFKAWRKADLTFGKVTGFFGTNSAGKSSLLQFLLLLKQTRNAGCG